jgi:glycerol dehydrogenase
MDEMEWLKPQKPFVYKSPAIYIQGPETSKQVGPYIAHMGKKPFIIGGTTALSLTEEDIKASYAEAGIEVAGVNRGLHLCTDKVIAATLEEAQASECDYVLGVGGGTIVDIARAVASKNEQYYAVVGTVASMAGFTSALSVIYNDDSTWDRLDFYPEDTHAVIMDSKIIAEGPVYHTINGMGDAFCIKWESEVVERGKNMNLVGGYATQIGLMIANECWNQLKRFGYQAVKANEKKLLTPALERIIETNTFMAGVGFESGALGGGHAIHDGLVGAGAIALHKTAPEFRPHGQVISYTTLTQLVMEDRDPAQIMECIAWCDSVGLAITWDDLFGAGKTPPDDQLWKASKMACSADKVNVLFGAYNVTPAKIYTSLQMVDTLGHIYRDEIKPNMPPYVAPGMIPTPPRENYFDRLTTI